MGDPKDFGRDLKARLEALATPENMKRYGQAAVDIVVKRTRLGYGVADIGYDKEPLKPLSTKYVDQRKRMQSGAEHAVKQGLVDRVGAKEAALRKRGSNFKNARHESGGLSPDTTPSRSNLTRTGQLLKSEDVKVVGSRSVTFGPTGNRTEGGASNEDIAGYQKKQGRTYNNLSQSEINQIKAVIQKDCKKFLEKK